MYLIQFQENTWFSLWKTEFSFCTIWWTITQCSNIKWTESITASWMIKATISILFILISCISVDCLEKIKQKLNHNAQKYQVENKWFFSYHLNTCLRSHTNILYFLCDLFCTISMYCPNWLLEALDENLNLDLYQWYHSQVDILVDLDPMSPRIMLVSRQRNQLRQHKRRSRKVIFCLQKLEKNIINF